jgi:hypothetical protein
MRSWRFESERPQLFRAEASRELVHTKNVIELSVLRRGSGASSAEEYELTRNASKRLKKRDRVFAISLPYREHRLIFCVRPRTRDIDAHSTHLPLWAMGFPELVIV